MLGVAALCLVVGVLGLVLPHRFNPLRLRRVLGGLVSERVDRTIPKVLGWLFVARGSSSWWRPSR
jgi:hypothetical protein